jgi:predicted metal-dependent HD superfamily phosphohydrolase
MSDNHSSLLSEAQSYVTDLLSSKLSKTISFHTLQHTQEVVSASERIADHYQLPDEDRLPLMLAAWFHDTGYTSGNARDHESVSISIANDFLSQRNASEELKKQVTGCINATRMPQNPTTTIERILCDADLFHLGTNDFSEKNRILREEFREFGGIDLSKKEWRKMNIEFLQAHNYFTTYGREKLQPAKEIHLLELRDKNKEDILKPDKKGKDKNKDKMKDKDKIVLAAEQVADEKKKKAKDNQTERGINTVFRIMAQTQNNLSQMADNKANILISVNAIVLSVVISALFPKLESNTHLLVPALVLVLVCVTVIIFAILATRPNISGGTFTKEDIANKQTNLLFFGNFYKMGLHDYDWAMMEMLNDKQYLYTSVVKDSYFLGVVLAKKYKLLRIAYNIFMYGLIVIILAFALAFIIPQPVEVYAPGVNTAQ